MSIFSKLDYVLSLDSVTSNEYTDIVKTRDTGVDTVTRGDTAYVDMMTAAKRTVVYPPDKESRVFTKHQTSAVFNATPNNEDGSCIPLLSDVRHTAWTVHDGKKQ